MTTAEALDKVQEFRQLLDLLDKEEKRPGIRSEINQLMPLVRRIIGMTGQGKTVTIGPPPMIGGLVMKNINPFDILFTPPYGMFNDILSYCIKFIRYWNRNDHRTTIESFLPWCILPSRRKRNWIIRCTKYCSRSSY